MNVYQNAVDALKECVKDAMENDVPSNLQGEIWRHYQGMKAITKQVNRGTGKNTEFEFNLDTSTSSLYDPDYNIQAAQPVDNISISTGGDDVITFS